MQLVTLLRARALDVAGDTDVVDAPVRDTPAAPDVVLDAVTDAVFVL